MIGLGGGSLAKFFHRTSEDGLRVKVVELDERVVAAAREHFAAADDERSRWRSATAPRRSRPSAATCWWSTPSRTSCTCRALASAEFYDGAFLALAEPGALVVNFMNDDPKFDQTLQRLERAFGGAVLVMPALYDPNILVFALKGVRLRHFVGARCAAAPSSSSRASTCRSRATCRACAR